MKIELYQRWDDMDNCIRYFISKDLKVLATTTELDVAEKLYDKAVSICRGDDKVTLKEIEI